MTVSSGCSRADISTGKLPASGSRGGSLMATSGNASTKVRPQGRPLWPALPQLSTGMMARLLATGVLLSLAYTFASYALCSMLGFITLGLPTYDLGFAEDLGMFALFLALWLLSRPLLTDKTPKEKMAKKGSRAAGSPALAPLASALDADSSQTPSCGSPRLRRAQRRRHLRQASEQLRHVVGSLSGAAVQCCRGPSSSVCSMPRASSGSVCGLHNFHAASRRSGFLLPVEVAACHYPQDISEHLQRLLEDRWALLETAGSGGLMTPIPE